MIDYQEATFELIASNVSLPVIDATITLDEHRRPYITGTVTTTIPTNRALLDIVTTRRQALVNLRQMFGRPWAASELTDDNLKGCAALTAVLPTDRVSDITGRYWRGLNAPKTTRVSESSVRARLDIVRTELDEARQTVTWELESVETRLFGDVLIELAPRDWYTRNFQSITHILALRNGLGWGEVLFFIPGQEPEAQAYLWSPQASAWEFLESIMEQIGLRVHGTLDGTILVDAPEPLVSGTVAVEFAENAVQIRDVFEVASDAWFDAVMIEYTFINTAGNPQTRRSSAGAQPSRNCLVLVKDNTYYPGTDAAAKILARVNARKNRPQMTALTNYSARPGMVLTVTNSAGITQTGRVSAVTFTYPRAEMDITARSVTA